MKKILSLIVVLAMVMAFVPAAMAADVNVSTPEQFIAALQNGNTVKLTADIELLNTAIVSAGTITIDLNGCSLTTVSPADDVYEKPITVLDIKGGDVTITGNGMVQSGKVTNSSSWNSSYPTIKVTGTADLSIENGAVIKGAEHYNSRECGNTISFSATGALDIINASVLGADMIKQKSTESPINCSNQGTAGSALSISGGNAIVSIDNSLIKGGDGLNDGYSPTYISGGMNFAEGGFAINNNGANTFDIDDSEIIGGDSALYNAQDAINVGTGTFNIANSTIRGGNAQTEVAGNGYGIGGSALSISSAGSVTLDACSVIGGSGGDSWLGCGIEYNNLSAVLTITNSVISGGGVTGTGEGFGNAFYTNKWSGVTAADFNNVTLTDTLLMLGADPSRVYGGSSIYYYEKPNIVLNELLAVICDQEVLMLGDGRFTFGDAPEAVSQTEVKAGVDPTFMIIIPSQVDFGTVVKNTGMQEQDFSVEAQNVVIEPGAGIEVRVDVDDGFKLSDGSANTLDYSLYNVADLTGATPLADGDLYHRFVSDQTVDGKVTLDTDQITVAGSYSDIMNFIIEYKVA